MLEHAPANFVEIGCFEAYVKSRMSGSGISAGFAIQGSQLSVWSFKSWRPNNISMFKTIRHQVERVWAQWPRSKESQLNKGKRRKSWRITSPSLKQSSKQRLLTQRCMLTSDAENNPEDSVAMEAMQDSHRHVVKEDEAISNLPRRRSMLKDLKRWTQTSKKWQWRDSSSKPKALSSNNRSSCPSVPECDKVSRNSRVCWVIIVSVNDRSRKKQRRKHCQDAQEELQGNAQKGVEIEIEMLNVQEGSLLCRNSSRYAFSF